MSSLVARLTQTLSQAMPRPGRAPEQPLSPRLAAVGAMVPHGAVLADIGTDHGWLPVHLVHQRHVPRAIAADVKQAPLEGARQRIADHRLSARIETRLGNGLTVLQPGEVTAVSIAGMGGKRIVELVRAAPEVLAELDCVVVQPNTDVPWVRQGLRDAGLRLLDEHLMSHDGRWYTTLAWAPGTEETPWTAADLQFGPHLRARAEPALRRRLGDELSRVALILARATHQGASAKALREKHDELTAIEAELARLSLVEQQIRKA